jgi:hypothetical protein
VRDLVGHTSRSILRVEEFAAQRADRVDIASATEHYRMPAADDDIAERGRVAGGELGDDPAGVIQNAADRVIPLVDQVPGSTVIAYPYGGIRLDHYLGTRVLELTVHTLDLAAAIGVETEPADRGAQRNAAPAGRPRGGVGPRRSARPSPPPGAACSLTASRCWVNDGLVPTSSDESARFREPSILCTINLRFPLTAPRDPSPARQAKPYQV